MNGKEITKNLRESGLSVNSIAEELGVKPPTVSQVIHRKRPNPRIRKAIASAIGRSVDEVWPPEKEAA